MRVGDPPRKKRAEGEPDDPRLDRGEGVEMVTEPASKKRPADEPADDRSRGDLSALSDESCVADARLMAPREIEGASADVNALQNRRGCAFDRPEEVYDSHRGVYMSDAGQDTPVDGERVAETEGRVASHTVKPERTHTCSHCDRGFDTRNLLFKHLYEHHDEDGAEAELRSQKAILGQNVFPPVSGKTGGKTVEHNLWYFGTSFDPSTASCAEVQPLMAVEDYRGHPSPVLRDHEIDPAELQWKNIGSGVFAKTFRGVDRLPLTSRGGPASSEFIVVSLDPCQQEK